jgi:hypothetical protein
VIVRIIPSEQIPTVGVGRAVRPALAELRFEDGETTTVAVSSLEYRDPWMQLEHAAIERLAALVDTQPFDRGAVEQQLHEFAKGKNRNVQQAMPDTSILTDAKVREMVRAILAGNRVGF